MAASSVDYQVTTFDQEPNVREVVADFSEGEKEIFVCDSASAAVQGADIVVLATPIDRFSSVLDGINGHIKDGVIVTDIGSGKIKAIKAIEEKLPENAIYIPAHPIAGKSECGPENSDVGMYANETVVVVPSESKAAQKVVEDLWNDCGATIAHMDGQTHDRLYGTISHFEHVIAFALTAAAETSLRDSFGSKNSHDFGDSFLNTTRISRASAGMWLPIFTDNKDAVLEAAKGFKSHLNYLKDALHNDSLQENLQEAHTYRKTVKGDRPREGAAAEMLQMSKTIKKGEEFNQAAVHARYSATQGLTTLLSAAITLNARDTEGKLNGIAIADVANPSFKDGSAPMLSDPAFTAIVLSANKEEILENLQRFETEFDGLVQIIEKNDKPAMKAYIKRVADIRDNDNIPKERGENEISSEYTRPSSPTI